MNRRLSSVWVFGSVLFFVVLLKACDISTRSNSNFSPPRPANVPTSAIWVGGSDGGVFFELKKFDVTNGHGEIQVFHQSGDVWFEGPVRLEPKDSTFNPAVEKEAFKGWDGTDMHLTKERRLHTVQ